MCWSKLAALTAASDALQGCYSGLVSIPRTWTGLHLFAGQETRVEGLRQRSPIHIDTDENDLLTPVPVLPLPDPLQIILQVGLLAQQVLAIAVAGNPRTGVFHGGGTTGEIENV